MSSFSFRRLTAQAACFVFGHLYGSFYSNHDGSASRQCYRCFKAEQRTWYL